MGKFHYRKPRTQTFGFLRLRAVEVADCRTIDVELVRGSCVTSIKASELRIQWGYTLSMKDSERLIQWVHRFDYWKRERERYEKGEGGKTDEA